MALCRALDVPRLVEGGLSMKEQRPVETVEDFKLRIAAIISGNPDQIPAPRRTNPLLVRRKKRPTNPKAKRRTSR
jgi:hypothetical protein